MKLEFETIEEYERNTLKYTEYYTAIRFLGRANYHRLEAVSLPELCNKIKTDLEGDWMIYAVCPQSGTNHDIHLGNIRHKKGELSVLDQGYKSKAGKRSSVNHLLEKGI